MEYNLVALRPVGAGGGGRSLAGCSMVTLKDASFDSGTLILNFEEAKALEADKSYLIKWENDGSAICDPVFSQVTILRNFPAGLKLKLDENGDYRMDFQGTYNYLSFDEVEDRSVLFIGADNMLYYPLPGASIGACRSYFELYGLNAGDLSTSISKYVLNFGDELGISSLNDNNRGLRMAEGWYTLDGRKVSGEPRARGIYVHDGKKVCLP